MDQFVLCLQTVNKRHGYSIKTVYGSKFCKILSFDIFDFLVNSNLNTSFNANSILQKDIIFFEFSKEAGSEGRGMFFVSGTCF